MKSLKIILISICIVLISTLAYSDTHFYVFGRGNFFGSSGSASDYEEGENDFPIASSHKNYGAGFGLTFGKRAFIGIEGHYNLSGKVTLTDPSDDDTVEIDTYKYVSGFITVGFNIVNSRSMRLYINGGGGICRYFEANEIKSYVSRLGFETLIEPPEKKTPMAGFGGVGLEFYLSKSGGILLSGRYLYIGLDEPQTIYVAQAGFVFRF